MAEHPTIWIQRSDYHRLAGLASAQGLSQLAGELARAIVCHAGDMPTAVVRMGARVVFRRDLDAPLEWAELVFPDQATDHTLSPPLSPTPGEGRVSVTSPLGAAMIGLRAGARMAYQDADGRRRHVVIERVTTP